MWFTHVVGLAQPRAPETGVPLVAFTLKPEKLEHGYTEFDVADRLRQSGWVVPVRMVHTYIHAPKVPGWCAAGAHANQGEAACLQKNLLNVIASLAGSSQCAYLSRLYDCIRLCEYC